MKKAETYRGLTQVVVERLREDIYDGKFKPGEKLNIADLSKDFDISPLPVREALRNLETDGLVQLRHNRGAIVTDLTPADIREIFLIRAPLEETVAVAAAERRISPKQLAALEYILQQMDKRALTNEWFRLHHRFHVEIYRLSGLPRIAKLLEVYRGQMRGHIKHYLGERNSIEQMQSEHRAMVDCLRKQDTEKIRAVVHAHLSRPVHSILAIIDPASGAPQHAATDKIASA